MSTMYLPNNTAITQTLFINFEILMAKDEDWEDYFVNSADNFKEINASGEYLMRKYWNFKLESFDPNT